MFGIGSTELFIILLFAFLIFGPEKLPQIGRTIGRAMRQFRNAQDEMNKVIRTEVYDPIMDNEPLKNPAEIITGKSSKKSTDKRQVKKASSTETFAERRARLAKEQARKEHARTDASPSQAAAAPAATPAGASEPAAAQAAEKPRPAEKDPSASASGEETFAARRARFDRQRAARETASGQELEQPAAVSGAGAAETRPEQPSPSLAEELYDLAPQSNAQVIEGGEEAGQA